jgi:catechol 2,3-dioxygenase-like lactoylglutathione lyase family enzyme
MPFDHLGFNVSDFAKSKAFYAAALGALGMKPVMEGKDYVALGPEQRP